MAKQAPTSRDLWLKSKVYRVLSLAFIMIGLLIFSIQYINNVDGRFLEALRNPEIVLIFLIPFIPAFFLFLIANSYEKKYLKAVEADRNK
jgi:hypothetical protein